MMSGRGLACFHFAVALAALVPACGGQEAPCAKSAALIDAGRAPPRRGARTGAGTEIGSAGQELPQISELRPAPFRVVCVDRQGGRIASASVRVRTGSERLIEARTGADGVAFLDPSTGRIGTIDVDAEGRLAGRAYLNSADRSREIRIVLQAVREIEVEVRDTRGRAVQGVKVLPPLEGVRTDAAGKARIFMEDEFVGTGGDCVLALIRFDDGRHVLGRPVKAKKTGLIHEPVIVPVHASVRLSIDGPPSRHTVSVETKGEAGGDIDSGFLSAFDDLTVFEGNAATLVGFAPRSECALTVTNLRTGRVMHADVSIPEEGETVDVVVRATDALILAELSIVDGRGAPLADTPFLYRTLGQEHLANVERGHEDSASDWFSWVPDARRARTGANGTVALVVGTDDAAIEVAADPHAGLACDEDASNTYRFAEVCWGRPIRIHSGEGRSNIELPATPLPEAPLLAAGRVVDGDGLAVIGAEVTVLHRDGAGMDLHALDGISTSSGMDGSFTLRARVPLRAEGERFDLAAELGGTAASAARRVVPGSTGIDLIVERFGTLEGHVERSLPSSALQVRLAPENPERDRGTGFEQRPGGLAEVDDSGAFRFSALEPGTYVATLEGPQVLARVPGVVIVAGSATRDPRLAPFRLGDEARSGAICATDCAGTPIPGAFVRIERRRGSPAKSGFPDLVRTDESGRALVYWRDDPPIELSVRSRGFTTWSGTTPDFPLEIKLERTCQLIVRLDRPIDGPARSFLELLLDPRDGRSCLGELGQPLSDDGVAHAEDLVPGEYEVVIAPIAAVLGEAARHRCARRVRIERGELEKTVVVDVDEATRAAWTLIR